MPGFPGVTTTSAVRPSTSASTASRPPEPTTTTLMPAAGPPRGPARRPDPGSLRGAGRRRGRRQLDVLVAAGSDPEEVDRHPDLLLEEGDEVPGRLREVVGLGGPGDVGLPAGEDRVVGLGPVGGALVVRRVVGPVPGELGGVASPH